MRIHIIKYIFSCFFALCKIQVAWIHLDLQMLLTIDKHVISRVPRYSVTHDNQKTWMLNVANAQAIDRGFYMCQVNTNPMISQKGYLQVVVPPDIVDEESTPSSVAIRENHNLTLTCKARGFPEPRITWRREDGNEIVLDRKKKAQPTSAAEDKSLESDDLYSSEEYDSEDYEDKAKLDIRPLRDSRKLVVSPNTESTSNLTSRTTPTTTTIESSEPVTSEEIYTGTFKNVHNRKDFNYSLYVTLPTIIGTLFTVDIEEWRKSHSSRMASKKPLRLHDQNMKRLFSPRSNYTSIREYRRFVNWANREYKNRTGGATTPSWERSTRTFTLYPKEFDNDTAFQEYMSKNWMNTSFVEEYQSNKRRNFNGSYHARAWIDRIASREFHSRPWRNKNATGYREYGKDSRKSSRYWQSERNETARLWRRRPYYSEGNETRDFVARPWRRRPQYFMDEGNETVPGEFGPRPPRRRRPPYWSEDGNETMPGGAREGRPYYPRPYRREFFPDREQNETEPAAFEGRPWRELHPRREPPPREFWDERPPPPWAERTDRRDFGPPRRPEFETREWMEGRDFRQFEPPRPDFREFEPPRRDFREFEPPRRDSREFQPPRRDFREFEPPRRDSREFQPPRRGPAEFRAKYESRELDRKPPLDAVKAENKSTSREIDTGPVSPREEIETGLPTGRDIHDRRYPPSRGKFDDRRSRERDFDDHRPMRGKSEFDDRRPSQDRGRSGEQPPKERDFDDRRPSRDRGRFDDRPPKDRDFDERRPSRDRGRFDDRPPKDRDFDERRPSRDRGRFDDRPPRDRDSDKRRPSGDKEKFDDKSQKTSDSDERRPAGGTPREDKSSSDGSKAIDRLPSEEFDSKPSKKVTESQERYRPSTRDYNFKRRTSEFSSYRRSEKSFWDKKKEPEDAKGTTADTFALQAKFYRKRIEQRREKELQLLEKKRKMFWQPTDSNEATADTVTTTTIKTTSRRSYNKLGKLFAKQSQTPHFEDEQTLEPPDQAEDSEAVTATHGDKFVADWTMYQTGESKMTRLYDWVSKRDEGTTHQSGDQKNVAPPKDGSKKGTTKSMQKGKNRGNAQKKGSKKKSKKG